MTYSILMRNVLTLAEYDQPTALIDTSCERLVVDRLTLDGVDYLTITEAGRCNAAETQAPKTLEYGNTLIGTLIRRDGGRGQESFIFNRVLPKGFGKLRKGFFPGDGCVDMLTNGTGFTLRASGRHMHELDDKTGMIRHACEPFEDSSKGLTWLFDAQRIAWAGETLPAQEGA